MSLSNKEKLLIEDNLNTEYLCIRKYQQYAAMSQDQGLKQVFSDLAGREQKHAATLKGILSANGITNQSILGTYNSPQGSFSNVSQDLGFTDAELLNDALYLEKHVSSSYNNAVLESADANIRKQLQHIQNEEQGHAETLFKEMQSRGLYKMS